MSKLVVVETKKDPKEIIENIKEKVVKFDFIVREIFNMSDEFKRHNVEVSDEFEYYSVMICNPSKAYKNMSIDPIRGAVLLPPKQIIVYKNNGKTTIAYMATEKSDIEKVLPDDKQFQEGLSMSCGKVIKLIESI
jgi:uncharacterized protein (DUF302 family)